MAHYRSTNSFGPQWEVQAVADRTNPGRRPPRPAGNLDMDYAFIVARRYARDHGEKLSDVAGRIVNRELRGETLIQHAHAAVILPWVPTRVAIWSCLACLGLTGQGRRLPGGAGPFGGWFEVEPAQVDDVGGEVGEPAVGVHAVPAQRLERVGLGEVQLGHHQSDRDTDPAVADHRLGELVTADNLPGQSLAGDELGDVIGQRLGCGFQLARVC